MGLVVCIGLAAVLVPILDSWGPEPLEANAVAVALLAVCGLLFCTAERAGRAILRDVALVAGASFACSIAAAAGAGALASDAAVAVIAGRIVWVDGLR
jgi:hypothetical protein